LGATIDLESARGRRVIPFDALHRLPGDTPHIETTLKPGELITGFSVPTGPWTRRSLYLKIRDRQSYEFALTSAAVALDLDAGVVRQARVGLGGIAAKPWRSPEVEAVLLGLPPGAMAGLYQGKIAMLSGSGRKDFTAFAFGAHFVELRIHERTREIRVPRVVSAFAAGTIINPLTAYSQFMGGLPLARVLP
jgi:CO/xanthine dehydrogenase FAD-binding subunit